MSPLEVCRCIDQCEYDELYTDERICQGASMTGKAQLGEICEGFNERTGGPFPSCAEGLKCESTCEISIPGACNTCVPKDGSVPMQESGSMLGLSVAALHLACL